MLPLLLHMVLRMVFRLAPFRDERDHEVEILVLRREVKVLKRKPAAPSCGAATVFLAAASSILPRSRWSSFILTPTTVLRWHRALVRRKWTPRARRRRPPLEVEICQLSVRRADANRAAGT